MHAVSVDITAHMLRMTFRLRMPQHAFRTHSNVKMVRYNRQIETLVNVRAHAYANSENHAACSIVRSVSEDAQEDIGKAVCTFCIPTPLVSKSISHT